MRTVNRAVSATALVRLIIFPVLFTIFQSFVLADRPALSLEASPHQVPLSHTLLQTGNQSTKNMGNVGRMMSYDRAANERSAVTALQLLSGGTPVSGAVNAVPVAASLKWYRLDDGVMGGQSESDHIPLQDGKMLHFQGTINTNGGGFCSIRTKFEDSFLSTNTEAIKLVYRGDGKTYKLILSDGNRSTGGPFGKSPSWQVDLPTQNLRETQEWEERTLPLSSLLPNWGGRMSSRPPEEERAHHKFIAEDMRELGLMLSLKLANGQANPVETFGSGIFPFSLMVKSIEVVHASSSSGGDVCEADKTSST